MANYDATKMRSIASDIRSEITAFNTAKENIDTIVTDLKNNWSDDNNTAYANKYNNEAKVSAEKVKSLMEAYAKLLEESAASWDRLYNSTGDDIRG